MNDGGLKDLQAENARLILLLEKHGIKWRLPKESQSHESASELSTDDKIALFQQLFRGRSDLFALRWESQSTGRFGYAPACANEWRAGICEKPRIKCADCSHRQLIPPGNDEIYQHLSGQKTLGLYPLLADNTCYLVAVDFDKAQWRTDLQAFRQTCVSLGVPVAIEVSRSGQGGHAWIFFNRAIQAALARRLATALITHTCANTHQLELSSYDRILPAQDQLPRGGFGNLIALPLQKKPREEGFSVFVDELLDPIANQWSYLQQIEYLDIRRVEELIEKATGGAHPLDIAFINDGESARPWDNRRGDAKLDPALLPNNLTITMAGQLYIEKQDLSALLQNRLVRLAAFQNPEFYKAQAMRFSVWDKPRVIGCAENHQKHIALPRGCLDAVQTLCQEQGIGVELTDKRTTGKPLKAKFLGSLHPAQKVAVTAMLKHDTGVLCAPTAFGKTVTAAALIEHRSCNTLILVHRKELQQQWFERLKAFLDIGDSEPGLLGGGKKSLNGGVDIAVVQSLVRKGVVNPIVQDYGQVIIDECHHVSAVSFEYILKEVKAKYVVGLTATPIRRDGLQPIIFMQCGPVRNHAKSSPAEDLERVVEQLVYDNPLLRQPDFEDTPEQLPIQTLFGLLARDQHRTALLIARCVQLYDEGRKILLLSERTEHIDALVAALPARIDPVVLHGRVSATDRKTAHSKLDEFDESEPRLLVATGKLVGEGFDHPALDTLVLAMPISWKGTLQQYVGRLHRASHNKQRVDVIDLVDLNYPVLTRMWERRLKGYRALGYDWRGVDLLQHSPGTDELPL